MAKSNVKMKTTESAAKPAPTKSEGKAKPKLKVAAVTPGQKTLLKCDECGNSIFKLSKRGIPFCKRNGKIVPTHAICALDTGGKGGPGRDVIAYWMDANGKRHEDKAPKAKSKPAKKSKTKAKSEEE